MPSTGACRCGCQDTGSVGAHRIAEALARDDLDAALSLGLLDSDGCDGCTPACRALLREARDARRFALAARERMRASEARLARRQAERLARRGGPSTPAPGAIAAATPLPPAAAAALERAMARVPGARRK